MHTLENYLLDAIEMVSALDLPEEDFADAVNAQVRLTAGVQPDEYWCFDSILANH